MAFKAFPDHPLPLADFPVDGWRWPNFSVHEMACKDAARSIMIHTPSLDNLQRLRTSLGVPLKVNSAYRTREYNAAIGGAAGSMHLAARAYDIDMAGHDPHEFEAAARKAGFTGFGFYPASNFMHIDTGPAREWGEPFPMYEDDAVEGFVSRRAPAHGMPVEAASLVKAGGNLKAKQAARMGQDA